jgi:hypothetical protein
MCVVDSVFGAIVIVLLLVLVVHAGMVVLSGLYGTGGCRLHFLGVLM